MSFIKRKKTSDYSAEKGNVRYLDAQVLKRPFHVTIPVVVGILIIGAAAAAVSGHFALQAIDEVQHGEERKAQAILDNINREHEVDVPHIEDLIAMEDEDILAQFDEAGFVIYNYQEEGDEGIDLMKIPADVDAAKAKTAFSKGIGRMSASEASQYLVGAWRFTCSRGDWIDMRIRYCDLTCADATEALNRAMETQGWLDSENVSVTEEGIDSIGNHFREGTVSTDHGRYSWRISCCDMDEVYNVSGLPETAQYVGIRMTA